MPNVNPRTGALSGQFDVFIPKEPMPDLGDLLKQFFQFCRNLGFRPTRREKKGGGHVTSWWCEFPLNDNAPSKSVVQFGETNYGELAPHMSMWGRASEGYYEPGRKLLVAAERVKNNADHGIKDSNANQDNNASEDHNNQNTRDNHESKNGKRHGN